MTCRDWENSLSTATDHPSYRSLHAFLQNRSSAEEMNPRNVNTDPKMPHLKSNKPGEKKVFVISTSKSQSCCACSESHLLINCPVFAKKSPLERYNIVKSANICFNCFRNHSIRECTYLPCKICKSKHHIMLHREKSVTEKESSSKPYSSATEHEKSDPKGFASTVPTISTLRRHDTSNFKNQFVFVTNRCGSI